MHFFKRFYLLFSIVFSFAIPSITFTNYVQAIPASNITQSAISNLSSINGDSNMNTWIIILTVIYSIGVLIFSAKFIFNLYNIVHRIYVNPKYKSDTFINVLLKDLKVPHTFLNYIFLNRQKFESQDIPQEVLLHEQAHAKQMHSIDIIIIEILLIFFWFHPVIHLVKKSIKLNHEFLADQAVLNQGVESSSYQKLLLSFSFYSKEQQLANAINYSSIKKRFTIMKTKTSKSSIWIRSIIILPLTALLLFGFSNNKTVLIPSDIESEIEAVQKGATKAQVAEYNKLAKHYNAQPKDQVIYKKSDLERLKYLYHLMSESQRAAAEKFPVLAPPPAPKPPVTPVTPVSISVKKMPPPPPPIPDDATPEEKRRYKEAIKNYKIKAEKTKLQKKKLMKVKEVAPPKSPPAPKPPLEHVIEMSKKGAVFYYEGKKISSDKAISLLKKNNKLNISSKGSKSKQPVVHISTKPFVVEIESKN